MTLSDTHDGYNITCSVSYPVDGGKRLNTAETVTLHVSYAPKDTSASISPSGLVSAGSWVKLSCSSRAKPPVSSFSWFRISSEGPVNVSEEQLYSFNASEGGEFYCVAANDLGNQTSPWIKLRLSSIQTAAPNWGGILGGVLGTLLICLIVAVCCFKFKHQTQQQTQKQSAEKASVETPSREAELHYGDVNILKVKASSQSEQDTGQQKETVYAEVKVSKETGDSPEDLYSKVK